MATEALPKRTAAVSQAEVRPEPRRKRRGLRMAALFAGAVLFVFPFYYMLIGSLQAEPNTDLSGIVPNPGNFTLHNYKEIDGAINLGRTLINSGIFTGGVLLCTVVFGLLAGYALAVLQFRGKGAVFAGVMLVLVIPFQLLTVPLYVLIVRDYGLADNYKRQGQPVVAHDQHVERDGQQLERDDEHEHHAREHGALAAELQHGQRITGQQPEDHRAEQHAAGEDAGVDERAAERDRAVDVAVVVEREVARVGHGAGHAGVRLGLQRADQHVVEGEDEQQRAAEQQREPQPAALGARLRARFGARDCAGADRLGSHHARSSSSRRLSSDSTMTPSTSMIPIAEATSGLPCSIPSRYISRTGVDEAPSGPPPPVSR